MTQPSGAFAPQPAAASLVEAAVRGAMLGGAPSRAVAPVARSAVSAVLFRTAGAPAPRADGGVRAAPDVAPPDPRPAGRAGAAAADPAARAAKRRRRRQRRAAREAAGGPSVADMEAGQDDEVFAGVAPVGPAAAAGAGGAAGAAAVGGGGVFDDERADGLVLGAVAGRRVAARVAAAVAAASGGAATANRDEMATALGGAAAAFAAAGAAAALAGPGADAGGVGRRRVLLAPAPAIIGPDRRRPPSRPFGSPGRFLWPWCVLVRPVGSPGRLFLLLDGPGVCRARASCLFPLILCLIWAERGPAGRPAGARCAACHTARAFQAAKALRSKFVLACIPDQAVLPAPRGRRSRSVFQTMISLMLASLFPPF
ncbi:unnamed protein product [Prorocentrum cordatum]|uniref:Uncharacterized protein n=1 Tax=Prorocentrum cordatum TaxID=2364126 RepID=A0ABN9VDZ8_9DINO|nr:unnamed protein product [Polarella glacialis]